MVRFMSKGTSDTFKNVALISRTFTDYGMRASLKIEGFTPFMVGIIMSLIFGE